MSSAPNTPRNHSNDCEHSRPTVECASDSARTRALRDLCPPRTTLLDLSTTEQPPVEFAQVCSGLGISDTEQLRRIAVAVGVQAAAKVESLRREAETAQGHVVAAALKSSEVDPVTEVDRASEELIRRELTRAVPGSSVLGEEEGLTESPGEPKSGETSNGDKLLWVVDPIDGTVNFMYGVPAYAVSIAATVAGMPVAAAVVDVANHQVYSAACGGKALVQQARRDWTLQTAVTLPSLTPGPPTGLNRALLATGFSYDAARRAAQAEFLRRLLPSVRDIRRMGSAALDLCAVATGRVDGYFEHGLGPWDHAAGVLIAARAGAVVCMPDLSVQSADSVQVMAGNPSIAEALLEELKTAGTGGVLGHVGYTPARQR